MLAAPFVVQLEHAADLFTAARLVIEGRRTMALAEKLGTVADRMKTVPTDLGARADKLLGRLAALEQHGGNTFSALEAVTADAEAGVAAAEAALAHLSAGSNLK